MTRSDLVTELEAAGLDDVWILSRPVDHGSRVGVGVSFYRDGKQHRHAVVAPLNDESKALPLLRDWALQ